MKKWHKSGECIDKCNQSGRKMVQSGGCMINATKVDEKWRPHSFSRALVKHEKASEEALLSLHVAYAACSLSLSLSLSLSYARARARGSIFFSEVPFLSSLARGSVFFFLFVASPPLASRGHRPSVRLSVFPAFLLGHGYFLSSASMRFFLCHTFMNCPNCFLARVSLLL
jgi:hypothetical protein